MKPRLALIDYDTGNLHSAYKGLEYAGAEVHIVEDPAELASFDGLVLPGDGAFDPAMRELRQRGLEAPIKAAIANGIPFLGICIGLQVLFEGSGEGNEPGLGIIPGWVRHFRPEPSIRIPHMGWNQLQIQNPQDPLWQGIEPSTWVYFVHSYFGDPSEQEWISATVEHGSQTVTAAVSRGNVMATQFHPEKSGILGLQMVKNFVELVRNS
ncbi:MAG: imidazole glycerol phosphate synthase subunit HisH [Cyanophyceae cyanobacterium]